MNIVPLGRFNIGNDDAPTLPSIGSQRTLLDTLRGRALPATRGGNASAVERTGAIAMGAALAGAARANGWSDTATIATGVAIAAYALTSEQSTLLSVAQGILAPAIERWAATTFTTAQNDAAAAALPANTIPLARMPTPANA